MTRFAAAVIVVDQLDAVKCARIGAWVRQTFVDVALAFRANKTGRTSAIVAADFVNACTVVVARIRLTVVGVDFAVISKRSRWTRAHAAVD